MKCLFISFAHFPLELLALYLLFHRNFISILDVDYPVLPVLNYWIQKNIEIKKRKQKWEEARQLEIASWSNNVFLITFFNIMQSTDILRYQRYKILYNQPAL